VTTIGGPVVLIGIDAADVNVVERLLEAGELPNIAALRRRGAWGRLRNEPPGFLSLVWSSFFNGTRVDEHGWYYGKMWRPERQRLEYADPAWLPQRPFWDDLQEAGARLALVDIPFSMGVPPTFDGVYLSGWQCHDDFGRHVHPTGLWRELVGRFGKPAFRPEVFGPQTAGTLLRLRAEMLASLDQTASVCEHLLARERFDLFAVVLGGVHRGGHYLWDLSQIDARDLPADERRQLAEGNHDLYRAADAAVGRILAKAPASATAMVFALHGMGPNTGWTERFPELVGQIHRGGPAGAAKAGLVYRVKKALPWELVREVTTRLPTEVNKRLLSIWSARMFDWSTTRFFPLPVDSSGFVRLNLRGREAEGIVAPGNQQADVVGEVVDGFKGFHDIETGEPIALAVEPIEDLVGHDSPRRAILPDVVVRWSDRSAAAGVGVRSDRRGELRWERHARFQSGRAGNHLPEGWMAAAGPGIAAGAEAGCHAAVDLTPTIFSWLGLAPPDRFVGEPIGEVLPRPGGGPR
jgi:predicted AlkP superfamily phosphohydrolase/phosphomutase